MSFLELKLSLSAFAIVVSLVSLFASLMIAKWNSRASIKPVVVMVFEDGGHWRIQNVGNGPALNLVVAIKQEDGEWQNPVRVPPLSKDGDFLLQWQEDKVKQIGVSFEDFSGRAYTSICHNDVSRVYKGYKLKRWKDEDIKRHWKVMRGKRDIIDTVA